MLTGSEIRETFLRFFESKGHRRVHSSSLVPANDPTLLFTNAGMNQFKDVFLGLEKRDYTRATSSQKCVRAGGKHNDLENVGFTKRHHTFFEMLGNFSFGDYFKREAIAYAWEMITSKEWFNIDKNQLYCTIFEGEQGIPRDDEAEKYWLEIGMPKDRIFGLGMKDNFWSMADIGPCGPCSEIHYDMGPEASEQGHTGCRFPCECGRYVEFWNLVFMQFDRDASGTYNPLPKPSVDTGLGLERVAAILQSVISNYDTDLFVPLIRAATTYCDTQKAKLAGIDPNSLSSAASLRIIADHARATTFLIADGVVPSNEGRGYVLRKIMRRAMRHVKLLHGDDYVLTNMATSVTEQMAGGPYENERSRFPYPELRSSLDYVTKVIRSEEIRFSHTLAVGLQKLEELLEKGLQTAEVHAQEVPFLPKGSGWLSGKDAFKLYDTFGLPIDFILEAARDRGVQVNLPEFEQAMLEQRERAKASWRGTAKAMVRPEFQAMRPTVFEGYRSLETEPAMVTGIFKLDAPPILELNQGEEGEVLLEKTSFYADSGGQVGDVGWFYNSERNQIVADVLGCTMPIHGVRLHKVRAREHIRRSDLVIPVVSRNVRLATMRNHTGTHLLHAGLRETLGKHVKQAGSLVDPVRLRFDFSHFTGIADEELQDIEDMINNQVLKDVRVETIEDVPIDVAINEYKAMALFGEKYGERVRLVKIGDFSTELCGGIHTAATGEIGLIKILSEGSVSSGVRRVEAVTGEGSLKHFRQDHKLENVVATLIPQSHKAGSPAEALRQELEKKDTEIKKLQKEVEQLRMKSAASTVSSAEERVREIHGVKVLAQRVDNLDRNQMRTLVDNLRNKLGSGVVVLGSAQDNDGKVALTVGVTKDLTSRLQAGKIIKPVAEKVGGSGGGRPDMAEAGGKDPEKLDAALAGAYSAVAALLS